ANLERVNLTGNRDVALYAAGHGSSVTATELVVADTQAADCVDSGCRGAATGTALGSFIGAEIDVERFHLHGGALCGVHVHDGQVDLASGSVEGFAVGACVGDDEFDLSRLQRDV